MARNIGFVGARFNTDALDGVSLETLKWIEMLCQLTGGIPKENVFCFAGDVDRHFPNPYQVPEAGLHYPEIVEINNSVFGKRGRSTEMTRRILGMADSLRTHLHHFVSGNKIDLLVVENALTIPMNIPLGVAITQFIAETEVPTINHNHDFYWERPRFMINAIGDFLANFPPRLSSIKHVVISELALKTAVPLGIDAVVIPNVMDFSKPAKRRDRYNECMRSDFEIANDQRMILQPTRIVPRKKIERAILLLARLRDPKNVLVITHPSGDEGDEYLEEIRQLAKSEGVEIRFVADQINHERRQTEDGRKVYTLWDAYAQADFVTYMPNKEGFGNALLEAFWSKSPVICSDYEVVQYDIMPKGFDVVTYQGFASNGLLADFQDALSNRARQQRMVRKNRQIASQFYSYDIARQGLGHLVGQLLGADALV